MEIKNSWVRACEHAEKQEWQIAVSLAEQALDSPNFEAGASFDAVPVSKLHACFAAAGWAVEANDGAASKRLALKTLAELEMLDDKSRNSHYQVLASCIDWLSALSAQEGASVLENHPKLFGKLFGSAYNLRELAKPLDIDWYSVPALAKGQTPLTLSRWCIARGRPNWAERLLGYCALSEANGGGGDAVDEQGDVVKSLLAEAIAARVSLERSIHLLLGPLRLADAYSNETRWGAWPRIENLLYAEDPPNENIGSYQPPSFHRLKSTHIFDLQSKNLKALIDDCRRGRDNSTFKWERIAGDSISNTWWLWRQGTALLTFLSSPLSWLAVWLLPIFVLLWLYMDGGVGAMRLSTKGQAAFSAAFLIMWLAAVCSCRVVRFLRIEATRGRVAWIAVPIPIHRLATLKTDTIDWTNTGEHAENFVSELRVENIGEFMRIGDVHYRISSISFWRIRPRYWGAMACGVLLVFALLAPPIAIAAWFGMSHVDTSEKMSLIMAIPSLAALYSIFLASCLSFPFSVIALFKLLITGFFREMQFNIGYFDTQKVFVSVAFADSKKVAIEALSRIQQLVSQTRK